MQIIFFNESKKMMLLIFFNYQEIIQIKFGYGEVGSIRLIESN